MERLGRDALAVLDGLGIEKVNWCGLSMGGMVGQWLGANAPKRIDKLILSNTACYFPDKTMWDGRIKIVRDKGLAAIVDANMERWFTKAFRERSPQAIDGCARCSSQPTSKVMSAAAQAIRDMDHRPLLAKISAPTLVIAGRHDPATPLEAGEFIAQHIPGAKIAVLETAHIANIEQPQIYADTVLRFLLANDGIIRAATAMVAKLVRRRAGMLAEEAGEVRRIGKAKLPAISWIGWVVKTSWRLASVSTRWRIRWPAVTPVARLT